MFDDVDSIMASTAALINDNEKVAPRVQSIKRLLIMTWCATQIESNRSLKDAVVLLHTTLRPALLLAAPSIFDPIKSDLVTAASVLSL